MTHLDGSFSSRQDGIDIATYAWPLPEGTDARGVVQVAHGLAEHSARYDRFAVALNAAGYHVHAADHRGHGRSIHAAPGDFGTPGFAGLQADVVQLGEQLRDQHPDLPLVLFGHSMGSFATQHVLLERSDLYDAVVLSGSTALDVLAAGMGDGPVGDLSAFNAPFDDRTGYEWLSRDEAEVDAYVADPLCGFDLPAETLPSLFGGTERLADPAALAGIRHDLPILLASGTDDPLAGGGELIELLATRYRDAGVSDVEVVLYPQGRHEILNETNRDEVTADVIGWIDRHLGQ
ncbi:alpha/beta fold hydrolase [Aeromicrobium sp. Root472D3]|uniref:alpha/beta fold hydrolase n=1 Tax=Aeromicrobium sp. Root472D3 TaxID=1736540 RepID=UPI00070014BB|nr:alpha/beta hydrolase [Aeromicrobium sp. Root472D3]KQX74204.1 alpha/beta hydrolase [Aeromicrobium sp. Root472D3]